MIKRVMPRQNEEVNEIWICDKGRWAYHFAESQDRVWWIRWCAGTASWSKPPGKRRLIWSRSAWAKRAQTGHPGGRTAGQRRSVQSAQADRRTGWKGGPAIRIWRAAIGRRGLACRLNRILAKMGAETAILVVASDLEEEAPIWYLRVRGAAKRGAKLIVVNPRPTKLDHFATHVVRYAYGDEAAAVRAFLPGGEPAGETAECRCEGFYGSGERGDLLWQRRSGIGRLARLWPMPAPSCCWQPTIPAGRITAWWACGQKANSAGRLGYGLCAGG